MEKSILNICSGRDGGIDILLFRLAILRFFSKAFEDIAVLVILRNGIKQSTEIKCTKLSVAFS